MPVNPFDSPQKRKRGRPPKQEVEAAPPEPVMPAEPVYIPSFLQTTEPRLPPPPPPEPDPVPQAQRGDPKERVIGKAADTFTLDEVEYAKAQLKQFARDTDGDPRALAIIYSAIYTDILVQRIDVEIERLERTRPTDPYVNKKIEPLYKRRSTLWDDYCSNLEKLGAMPKDRKKDKLGDDVLSAVYAKYLEELNRRRAGKWPLGQPSSAAVQLANKIGDNGPAKVPVRPEILRLDVLSDEQRKDFVEMSDEPARAEGDGAEPDA
jgi:hypothetical protein